MCLRPIWAADSGPFYQTWLVAIRLYPPDEGSSVKLKITGAIPLYKTPGLRSRSSQH